MPKPRVTQDIPGVRVTPANPDDDKRCAYVSPDLGRCRYWGAIRAPHGAAAVCAGHYKHQVGPEAEQVVEASKRWKRVQWDIKNGQLVYDDGSIAPHTAA
ncbi:MAG: hypothetical protein IT349_19450 [Candidatus Eisenbacteria bacterium]|nr:hypothetical protein [Candidatus Eisenbacteria bacterium]